MKPHPFLMSVVAACATIDAGAVLAQRVSSDYRRDTEFGRLKTYAFADVEAKTASAQTSTYDSPLVNERTRAAIAAELQRRGMTQDTDRPDVYITTSRAFRSEY